MNQIIKSFRLSTRSIVLSGLVLMAMVAVSVPAVSFADTLYRQLDLGSRGSDVSSLQVFLSSFSDVYPSKLVTGYFGQLTKAAVERFQTSQGIVHAGTPATTGYGRVGPATMASINSLMGGGGNLSDTYAPVISSLSVSATNNSVAMNWNTSENSSAIIYYSTSPISMIEGSATSAVTIGGSSVLVHSDLRSSHSATITGLQANTTYHYVVYVRDGVGNENITWPSTFHTNQ